MKICGIYKIINKADQKYYVGSSNNIQKRWSQHKKELNRNSHINSHFQNAWNKYKEDNFILKINEEISQNELLITEQKYLDIAKNEQDKCYNISFIAGRVDMTNEIKQKLSISHKGLLSGENHPMYGKHHSNESKNKIKTSLLGRKRSKESIEKSRIGNIGKHIGRKSGMYGKHHTDETKLKISFSGLGRKHSDETKEKMRNSKLGKKYSIESVLKSAETRSKLWKFINPNGDIIEFKNLSLFCKNNNLDKSAMSNVFKKKANHHKGWKYV